MSKLLKESVYIGKPNEENSMSATLRHLFLKDLDILKSFLSIAQLDNICNKRPIITCEYTIPGIKNRIDILIKFPNDWVIIENKIDAGFTITNNENQLITYKRYIDEMAFEEDVTPHYILLCPAGRTSELAETYGFDTITYEQFYNKIKDQKSSYRYKDLIVETIGDICNLNIKQDKNPGANNYIYNYIIQKYSNYRLGIGEGVGYYIKPIISMNRFEFVIIGKASHQPEDNGTRYPFDNADYIKIGLFEDGKENKLVRKYLKGIQNSVFYFEDYNNTIDCCNDALSHLDDIIQTYTQYFYDKYNIKEDDKTISNIDNLQGSPFEGLSLESDKITHVRQTRNYIQVRTNSTNKYSHNWSVHYEVVLYKDKNLLVFHDERSNAVNKSTVYSMPKILYDFLINKYNTTVFNSKEECRDALIDSINYFDPILEKAGLDNLEFISILDKRPRQHEPNIELEEYINKLKSSCSEILSVSKLSGGHYLQIRTEGIQDYSRSKVHYEIIHGKKCFITFHDERNSTNVYSIPKAMNDFLFDNFGTNVFDSLDSIFEPVIMVIDYFENILSEEGLDNIEYVELIANQRNTKQVIIN